MRAHLRSACRAGDLSAAGVGPLLVMPSLGPPRLAALHLPLRIARFSSKFGGLALPRLGRDCAYAYTARMQTTLKPRLRAVVRPAQDGGASVMPVGAGLAPMLAAYRAALRSLPPGNLTKQLSAPLLAWAAADSVDDTVEPSVVHAMGCSRQHIYGQIAVHLGMKRCLQATLRRWNVSHVGNEDKSMFLTAPGQAELSADTVVYPGGICLCDDDKLRHKGVVLDTSIRACASDRYLKGKEHNAAVEDGYAAAVGETDKFAHHRGRLRASRWEFVPFVQECFGRMGRKAAEFVKTVASHSAHCKGGSPQEIKRRRVHVVTQIRAALSSSLAVQNAERVMAYARGAALMGRVVKPVSGLLSHSAA